jgi:glycerol-3-phosphate dehydrogenase
METNQEFSLYGRVVINATGIFTDDILKMDDPEARDLLTLSQGVHLVLDKEFLPGDSAIMVPHTDDGRVLFAVPWHNKVVVGTTDTPVKSATLEPRPLPEEFNFILEHAAKYLSKDPGPEDVLSIFAGIRPLVNPGSDEDTAAISRDHYLVISQSGLVTITGGKWTTYRKMGEDTINQSAMVAGLEQRESVTQNLRIHGWLKNVDMDDSLYVYGTDMLAIRNLIKQNPELGEKLHERLPYLSAEVVWAARQEMARTVEDVLARRTRALLLDARASVECAEKVADILAKELNYEDNWKIKQVADYQALAENYFISY